MKRSNPALRLSAVGVPGEPDLLLPWRAQDLRARASWSPIRAAVAGTADGSWRAFREGDHASARR